MFSWQPTVIDTDKGTTYNFYINIGTMKKNLNIGNSVIASN